MDLATGASSRGLPQQMESLVMKHLIPQTMTAVSVLALALAVGGCGSSSDSGTDGMDGDGKVPMMPVMTAAEVAHASAMTAYEAAVAADSTATDAEKATAAAAVQTAADALLMEAEMARDALTADATDADVGAAHRRVAAAQMEVDGAMALAENVAARQAAADVAEAARQAAADVAEAAQMAADEMAAMEKAEGERVGMAIGPGSTRAMPQPFMVDAGKVTTTLPDTADDMDDDLMMSSDAPAPIMGWAGAMYTRTTDADPDANPATPMTMDTVYTYTDQADPTDQAYSEYYSPGNASRRDAVASADADGMLVLESDVAGSHELFMGNFGITGAHQTIPAPIDDAATTGVDEAEVSVKGSFNGIPGTFMCESQCTRSSDKDGNLSDLGGTWSFTPTEQKMGEDPYIVAGVIPDLDYLDFGYWLMATTTEEDGETKTTYAVRAYAKGKRDYGSAVANVDGSATYTGPATGIYMRKTFDAMGEPTPVASGQFTADAMLEADFGGGDVAANNQFTVSGSVSDFRNSDGEMIDAAWTVELMKSAEKLDGTFTGMTTGNGTYAGTFHGDGGTDDAAPSAASGTFDGHFANGHVLGAFGANKQADD